MTSLNLLLVDDDDLYCDLVSRLVADDPDMSGQVRLTRLSDGHDVVSYLAGESPYQDRKQYPWPDLILLDQRMHRFDGTDVLRRCRDEGLAQQTSICMMTASEQPKLTAEALTLGARFCIVKPVDYDTLREMMSKIVDFYMTVAQRPERPISPSSR